MPSAVLWLPSKRNVLKRLVTAIDSLVVMTGAGTLLTALLTVFERCR